MSTNQPSLSPAEVRKARERLLERRRTIHEMLHITQTRFRPSFELHQQVKARIDDFDNDLCAGAAICVGVQAMLMPKLMLIERAVLGDSVEQQECDDVAEILGDLVQMQMVLLMGVEGQTMMRREFEELDVFIAPVTRMLEGVIEEMRVVDAALLRLGFMH